jgi:hypothetical protein
MGIKLDPYNVAKLISNLSPVLISFFFLMSSILDQNLKGFVYLLGVLLASFLNVFLVQHFNTPMLFNKEKSKPISCGVFELPWLVPQTSVPCSNTIFHTFTLSYFISMMNNSGKFNPSLIVFLSIIFIIDISSRYYKNCTTIPGIIFGAIGGTIYGILWFVIWWAAGIKEVLYYDELSSNNVKCVESKTKFVCKKKAKTATSG